MVQRQLKVKLALFEQNQSPIKQSIILMTNLVSTVDG
jgi:hypothetical protein